MTNLYEIKRKYYVYNMSLYFLDSFLNRLIAAKGYYVVVRWGKFSPACCSECKVIALLLDEIKIHKCLHNQDSF